MDLDELLDVDRESEKKWKKSYYQLKEDFEKLQNSHRRTPSPFMNSPSKKSYQDEVEELMKFKAHVKELEQKIKYLTHSHCLKITQKCLVLVFNLGIFHQFLSQNWTFFSIFNELSAY